jgi:multidrug resistance protein MdtO
MAPPASDRSREAIARFLGLLAPYPGRLEFAARLALLCALTTLVVEIYQTPEPALTAYVAFFVIKPDRAMSVLLSVVMLLLITVVIGGVILAAMAVVDQPLWRVTVMALISFGLLFAASASKLKPIGGIVALIAAYALDLLGQVQIGEVATRALLYAWLFVGIPAGVCIAVNLVLGPAPRRLAERALAHRLTLAAALLRSPDNKVRQAFAEALGEGTGEISTWLRLAGAEKTSPADEIAALSQAAASITPILLLVDLASRETPSVWPIPLRDRVARTLDEMASILRKGGYPVDITLDDADLSPTLPPDNALILAELEEALARFAEPPAPETPAPPAKKAASGFFESDAFTNPEHVHYALKTTAAAMFCYVVYELLDWPGIHTCLITCYIVSLGTTAETVEKLTLRVLGCLIGAAAGIAAIVFLMPHVTSIGGLMAVVFLAALASAWVAAGPPRIAYAGFQIAFAFFLCVIQGPAPAFDMTTARDRVIGILFGNLVVYLVFTNVWPTSVAKRIDPAIASLLRRLGAMVAAQGRSNRFSLAGETHAALGALQADIGLARYEPASIRPTTGWLGVRRQVARDIAALEAPLLLSAGQDPALSGRIAKRLDGLADRIGAGLAPALTDASDGDLGRDRAPGDAMQTMRRLIEAHLEGLEQVLTPRSDEQMGRAGHAPT